MQWYSKFCSLLRNLFHRNAVENELDSELASYIEERADRKQRGGLERSEALREARLEAGGVQQVKEKILAVRAGYSLHTFWQDVRYATHTLWLKPGLTLACVLTFAVGIGANTAIFSMVNGLVLRPVHAHRPERLTFFVARLGAGWLNGFSVQDFLEIRDQSHGAFLDVAGIQQLQHEGLRFEGRSQGIWVDYVSTNLFSLMGVKPALGTFFATSGKLNSDEPVLVLNYSFWQTQFSADPDIVGKTAFINGRAVTIIGVAEKGFHGPTSLINTQAFLPLGMAARVQQEDKGRAPDPKQSQRLLLVARLQDGVNIAEADSVLALISHRLAAQYPGDFHEGLLIRALKLGLIANSSGENPMPLLSALFLILSGLILLLAGSNVMNLLLVQAAARTREMALRSALGASRMRLIRQVLAETILTVAFGCFGGLVMGVAAARALGSMQVLADFPIVLDFSMDWRVFGYAVVMAAAVAITAGLTPAWRASSVDASEILREGGRLSSPGRHRLRTILVVSQLAASLTLLIVAGLFVRSLRNAEGRDLGFQAQQVIDITLDPHGAGYDVTRGREFYHRLRQRIQTLPGVEIAALAQAAPLDPENNGSELEVDGMPTEPGHRPQADYDTVSPEFLKALRIQLVRGRDLSETDTESGPRVAIINELMADRFWPGKDPIGRQFKRLDDPGHGVTVIGVMKNASMEELVSPVGAYFLMPLAQNYVSRQTLIVRTSSNRAAVIQPLLRLVREIDPAVPVYNAQRLTKNLEGITGFLLFRLGAGLASGLGLLGFLLAVIGLYGVISYSTAQRKREIGIRMALGAQRAEAISAIMRQGFMIVGCGVAAGVFMAALMGKLVGSFLINVSPFDGATYAAVSILLAGIALIASFIPARRASQVDPAVVLRQE